jgi:hypothetical protein
MACMCLPANPPASPELPSGCSGCPYPLPRSAAVRRAVPVARHRWPVPLLDCCSGGRWWWLVVCPSCGLCRYSSPNTDAMIALSWSGSRAASSGCWDRECLSRHDRQQSREHPMATVSGQGYVLSANRPASLMHSRYQAFLTAAAANKQLFSRLHIHTQRPPLFYLRYSVVAVASLPVTERERCMAAAPPGSP